MKGILKPFKCSSKTLFSKVEFVFRDRFVRRRRLRPRRRPIKMTTAGDPLYAKLCEESTKIFSEPCTECFVDIDYESNTRVADPMKPFTMALVGFTTPAGCIEANTLYITPVGDLSSTDGKLLNFAFGPNRVKNSLLSFETFSKLISTSQLKHFLIFLPAK